MIGLKLRERVWHVSARVAPVLSRLPLSKLRIGDTTLGRRAFEALVRLLHLGLPAEIRVHDGMIMYHKAGTRGQHGWLYAFDYEPETQHALAGVIRPGMTLVDVGAHIGFYTLLFGRKAGPTGRVYAFEPDPAYFALLVRNVRANGLQGVEAFPVAIADRAGPARLRLGLSTSSSFYDIGDQTGDVIDVVVTSLDAFFEARGWPRVDLVKLDIEGAEREALIGMGRLVRRNPDLQLIIEVSPRCLSAAGASPQELLGILGDLGFHRVQPLIPGAPPCIVPRDVDKLTDLAYQYHYVNLLCDQRSET